MKKLLICACLILSGATFTSVEAQSIYQQRRKESKEMREFNKERVTKDHKKRAKELMKQGWSSPGKQALEIQIADVEEYETRLTPNGDQWYLVVNRTSKGSSYDEAKYMAQYNARQDAAALLETKVASLGEGDVRATTGRGGSVSISLGNKEFVDGVLNKGRIIYEAVKEYPNGEKEASITMAYDLTLIQKMEDEKAQKEFEESMESMHNKLDEKTGW